METHSVKNKPTIRGLFKWWWKKKNVQGKGSSKSDHKQLNCMVDNSTHSCIKNDGFSEHNNMLVSELKTSKHDVDIQTKAKQDENTNISAQEMSDTKSTTHPLVDSKSRDSHPGDVIALPNSDDVNKMPNTNKGTTPGYVFPQYDGDQSYDVEENVLFFNDIPTMYGSMPNVNIYGKKKRRKTKHKRRTLVLERTQSHNVLSNDANSKLDMNSKSKRSKRNIFGRIAASLGSLTNLKRNGNSKHSDSVNSSDLTSPKQRRIWRNNKQRSRNYTSNTSTVISSPDCGNNLQKTSSDMRSFYDSLDSGFDNRLLSEDSEIEIKSTVVDVHSSAQLDPIEVVNMHNSKWNKSSQRKHLPLENYALNRTGLSKSLPLFCKPKNLKFSKRTFSISHITQTANPNGHFPADPLLRKTSDPRVIHLSPPPVIEHDQEIMNGADTAFPSLSLQDSGYTANNNNNVQILPTKLTGDSHANKLDRLKEDAVLKINQDLRKLSIKRVSLPQIKQSLTKQTNYYKASRNRSPRKIKSTSQFGASNTSKSLKKKYSDEQIMFTYDFSDTISSQHAQNAQPKIDNIPTGGVTKADKSQKFGLSRSAKIMAKPANKQVLKTKQNSANGSDTNLHFLSSSPSDCDSEKSRFSDIEPGHLSVGPLSHRDNSLNSEFTDVTSLASSNAFNSQLIKQSTTDTSLQFLFKPISPDITSSITSDDVGFDYDVFESPRLAIPKKIQPTVLRQPSFGELERDFNQFVINFNRKKNLKEKIVE